MNEVPARGWCRDRWCLADHAQRGVGSVPCGLQFPAHCFHHSPGHFCERSVVGTMPLFPLCPPTLVMAAASLCMHFRLLLELAPGRPQRT